ncbi:MAG TPA: hypothetical protein VJB14_07780 [Planctomycetota bacterium]|nr:hypothetical protein [Planctomycetota bacterium]
MKHHLSAIAAGALVSAALYGLLSAIDRPGSEPEDPWLDAWRAAGLQGQLVTVSSEPHKHLMFGDGRELCKGRPFSETVLRRYVIQSVSLQVVVLPKADLVPEFPEGRQLAFRLKKKGSSAHLCRSGRNLLFTRTQTQWMPFAGEPPVPKAILEKLFDAFEKTAAAFP